MCVGCAPRTLFSFCSKFAARCFYVCCKVLTPFELRGRHCLLHRLQGTIPFTKQRCLSLSTPLKKKAASQPAVSRRCDAIRCDAIFFFFFCLMSPPELRSSCRLLIDNASARPVLFTNVHVEGVRDQIPEIPLLPS